VCAAGGGLTLGARPGHIRLFRADHLRRSALDCPPGRFRPALGQTRLTRAQTASDRRLSAEIAHKSWLEEGEPLDATFPPNRFYLFDRQSGRALRGISE
jgi:hypothetical protein